MFRQLWHGPRDDILGGVKGAAEVTAPKIEVEETDFGFHYAAMREIYLDSPYGENGFWQRLPRLDPPALFIWGAHDWVVPATFSQHVMRALPQAQSVVLADCGHVPQFEQPEQTANLIREFLTP